MTSKEKNHDEIINQRINLQQNSKSKNQEPLKSKNQELDIKE